MVVVVEEGVWWVAVVVAMTVAVFFFFFFFDGWVDARRGWWWWRVALFAVSSECGVGGLVRGCLGKSAGRQGCVLWWCCSEGVGGGTKGKASEVVMSGTGNNDGDSEAGTDE